MNMKEARKKLGLSAVEMAAMLETTVGCIYRMEMDQSKKSARGPAVRMERLLRAYLDGWRPVDWPNEMVAPKTCWYSMDIKGDVYGPFDTREEAQYAGKYKIVDCFSFYASNGHPIKQVKEFHSVHTPQSPCAAKDGK